MVVDKQRFQQQTAQKIEEVVRKTAQEIKGKADQRVFRIVDGFENTRKEIAEIIRGTVNQNYQRQKEITDRLQEQADDETKGKDSLVPLIAELRSELDLQLSLIQQLVEHRFFRKFEIEEGDQNPDDSPSPSSSSSSSSSEAQPSQDQ